MKIDKDDKLVFEPLNTFDLRSNDVTLIQSEFRDTLKCIYELFSVFTDNNTSISALKYCNWATIESEVLANETNTMRTILKENHNHHQQVRKLDNKKFNAWYNCYGFVFLNGEYWLNLDSSKLEALIYNDNYEEVFGLSPNEDSIVIYCQNGSPIHAAKYQSESRQFNHKIGCNAHHLRENIDITDIYSYNSIRYLVKQTKTT